MFMRIIEIFKSELKPGERKGMSLNLPKLEKLLKKITDYEESAALANNMKVPDSVAAEYEKMKQGLYAEIDSLKQQKSNLKSEKNNLPIQFYNLMTRIANNCTQIVQTYIDLNPDFKSRDAKVFYRGIKSTEDALYGKPFDERRVMTSSSRLSDIFNKGMEAAGFEARRDNSSFVSGDKSQASGYGKVYVMFPKDGFSFSWSRNTKDLILDRGSYPKMLDYELLAPLKDFVLTNREKLGAKYNFTFNDLFGQYDLESNLNSIKQAIEAGDIPKEFMPLTELENIMTPEGIVKGFDLDQEDLTGAITSHSEVFVRGAYYAVQESLMKNIMKFLELQVYPEGKPKIITPGKYEIGDRVTVKSKGNHYYGLSGEVQYVYTNYDEVSVKLDGENWTNDFKIKDIKHESEADSETPDLKEGDTVEVTDTNSEYYGRSGTISYIYKDGGIEIFFKGGEYGTVKQNQIKILEPKTDTDKIKKGDTVEVTNTDSEYYGQSGTVSYIYNSGMIEIFFKSGESGNVLSGGFKKLDAEESEEKPEETITGAFKVGDQVKIIGKHPNAGDIATVDDVFDFHKDTTLVLDNGKKLHDVPFVYLEKIGASPKTLEIGQVSNGDKVKIIGDHASAGKTGKIIYAYSTIPQVDVEFDSGFAYDVPLKNIEKIKAEAENPNLIDAAYEVTMPGLTPLYQGQFLTQNEYDQAIDEYGDDTFTVKKLDNPDKNDPDLNLDNLKWEPEPEVKTPKQYSEGDKVKIIGTHNTGKTGTITQIQKSGNVIVKLDDSDDKTFLYPSEIEKIKTSEPEVIPVHSFKQGDSVKVIDGPAAGKTGKIAHVANIMKIADVTFSDGSTNYIGFKQLQLLDFPIQDIAKKKTPLKDLPAVQQLIKSAAQSNQVNIDQLDQAIGTLNPTSQEIEELMAYIANLGMEIVDSNSF